MRARWPRSQTEKREHHFISVSPPDVHLGQARDASARGPRSRHLALSGAAVESAVQTGTCGRYKRENFRARLGRQGLGALGPRPGTEGRPGTGGARPVLFLPRWGARHPTVYVFARRLCGSCNTGVRGLVNVVVDFSGEWFWQQASHRRGYPQVFHVDFLFASSRARVSHPCSVSLGILGAVDQGAWKNGSFFTCPKSPERFGHRARAQKHK